MSISPQVREQVEQLLGREPRGLEAVAVSSECGAPQVIQVASLVDDKPFPTLFWLIDADINYRIDQVEAKGLIAELQAQIDADEALQLSMREDHLHYIALRDVYMSDAMKQRIAELGFTEVFKQKGIGGIADFTRIRCLHTWYAAHMVRSNTVGRLLDSYWQTQV